MNFSVWVKAMRLYSLPLAAASILVGAGLAVNDHSFNLIIFALSLITAMLLQILSNLANDYGDAQSGADNESRIGPKSVFQMGLISAPDMKKAILILGVVASLSGLVLLSTALKKDLFSWFLFLGLGILTLFAAIKYTIGKNPYGYRAKGDIAVFLFFGLVAVLGSYYLYGFLFSWENVLPATSIGLLCVAVLNINNMRDMETDKASNKITLVVLFGRKAAFKYQVFLVLTAPFLTAIYFYLRPNTQLWQYVFLIILSPLIRSLYVLKSVILLKENDGEIYNTLLKNMSLTSFVFSLFFLLMVIPNALK